MQFNACFSEISGYRASFPSGDVVHYGRDVKYELCNTSQAAEKRLGRDGGRPKLASQSQFGANATAAAMPQQKLDDNDGGPVPLKRPRLSARSVPKPKASSAQSDEELE